MRAQSNTAPAEELCVRPASIRSTGRFSRCPAGRLRHRVEYAEPAFIPDVATPELIGVHARQKCELVDGLLRRKREGDVQWRAEIGTLEVSDAIDAMIDQAHVGNGIHRAQIEGADLLRPRPGTFGRARSQGQL